MSAINYAISKIRMAVPAQLLEKVLALQNTTFFDPRTLNEKIRYEIIQKIVMPDINVIGGETVLLPLDMGEKTLIADGEMSVFYFDKDLAGREITSVLSFTTNMGLYGQMGGSTSTTSVAPLQADAVQSSRKSCPGKQGITGDAHMDGEIQKRMEQLIEVDSTMRDPYNTSVTLVGKNTILLRYSFRLTTGAFKVQMSNDPELNNISNRSWLHFAQLCILAVKSYIYTQLIITIGEAQIYEGTQLGPFADYVQNLASAEEEYIEYLQTIWSRTSKMNDTAQYTKFIGSMINPLI
jgi:hypothetical protein